MAIADVSAYTHLSSQDIEAIAGRTRRDPP